MEEINAMLLVREYIRENRLSKSSLSRSLGMTISAFVRRIDGDYVDTVFLQKLCRVCNHDFFNDVSELMGMEVHSEKIHELDKEIEMLNREKKLLEKLLLEK